MIKEIIDGIKSKRAAKKEELLKQEQIEKQRAMEEARRKKICDFHDEKFPTGSLFVLDRLCEATEDVPIIGTIQYEYWEHECFYSDDPQDVLSAEVGKKSYMKQISHKYGVPDIEIPYKVVEGPVEKYGIGEGYNCNEIRVRSVDDNGQYKVYSTLMFCVPWEKRSFTHSVFNSVIDGPDISEYVSRSQIKKILIDRNIKNKKEARLEAIMEIEKQLDEEALRQENESQGILN